MVVIEVKSEQQFVDIYHNVTKHNASFVFLDFYATWCKPCMAIAPHIYTLSNKYPHVIFMKVDVDNNDLHGISQTFKVRAMPTFVLLPCGISNIPHDYERCEGADRERIMEMLETTK